eukprot:1156230-Pyramimonas_sp.AAC.1
MPSLSRREAANPSRVVAFNRTPPAGYPLPCYVNVMPVGEGPEFWVMFASRLQAKLGSVTFKTLADFNIPFDEIYFGKPHADVYIDDKSAASVRGNVRKQIGWYDGKVRGPS